MNGDAPLPVTPTVPAAAPVAGQDPQAAQPATPQAQPAAPAAQPVPVAVQPAAPVQPAVITPAAPVQPIAAQPVTPSVAPVAAQPAPAPNNPAAPVQAAEPPKPTLLQKVQSATRSRGSLLAESQQYRERAETAEAALTQLQGAYAASQVEVARLQGEQTEIAKALESSEGKAQTVEAAATEQIVALGVQPEVLPAAASGDTDTLESLQAQMAASTDPVEKGKLARKAKALRWED